MVIRDVVDCTPLSLYYFTLYNLHYTVWVDLRFLREHYVLFPYY